MQKSASVKMQLPSICEALKLKGVKPTRGKSLMGNVGHLTRFYSRADGNLEKISTEAVKIKKYKYKQALMLDTISNIGCIMAAKTLADKVKKSFSRIKIRKSYVKVPRLKAAKPQAQKPGKNEMTANSAIIRILIKAAAEKAKSEKKAKPQNENGKKYAILKDEAELNANGGYGSASKGYGPSSHSSYVDYGKLFSYLGKFKSQSAYENMAEHNKFINKSLENGSFVLADRETMDKGKFYVRYVNSKTPIDKSSLVPIAGMNSAEWEQFKMWMRLDTTIYLLKISTS